MEAMVELLTIFGGPEIFIFSTRISREVKFLQMEEQTSPIDISVVEGTLKPISYYPFLITTDGLHLHRAPFIFENFQTFYR